MQFRKLWMISLVSSLCVVAVATGANAQERIVRVTLDEALQLFGSNNLDLRISRAEAARVAGVARQARAYPNPVAALERESVSDRFGASEVESYLTVSQQIDWPWRYARRRSAMSRAADAAYAQSQADSLRLAFEVRQAFIVAARAQRVFRAAQDVAEVFRTAERNAAERFAAGDMSGYELRRIRVERARYETDLRHGFVELDEARRRLTALLVPESTDVLLTPSSLPGNAPPRITDSGLLELALARRPEIAAADLDVQAAGAVASVARWGALPDPTVTAGYKRVSGGLDGGIVGLELPLPLLDRRGGEADAAGAELEAARKRQLLTRRAVENDLRIAWQAYRSLLEIDQLVTDTLLAGTDDLLDIARTSYVEGEMTLLELMDAAAAFREAQQTRANVAAELWLAYYDLERAAGGSLDRTPGQEDR